MLIKKYLVSNMNEALSRIRNELGKNAVIISQRKVRKPGLTGFFSSKLIEVTAAVENSKKVKNTEVKEEIEFKDSIDSLKKIMENEIKEKKKDEPKEEVAITKEKDGEVEKLKDEILDIKNLLNKALGNNEEEIDYLEKLLEELDLCKSFYEEFKREIGNINNREEVLKSLRKIIFNSIEVEDVDIDGKVVFVGPTGVGKTTTIAKIAGRLSLKEKKRVGLITIDTYRIGAVEQLKTYAEIMDIDFKVILTQKEMEKAIEEMKNLDVILVDSTGRSSKNIMQISELRNLVSRVEADSTYLVVSATTKNKDLKEIIEGYGELSYNRIILTKLDETTTYGGVFNIQKLSGKPISYVTVGQNVPDDIINADKERLTKLILLEETL